MNDIINVSVKKLLDWACSPFESNPWSGEAPISIEEIANAIESKKFSKRPYNAYSEKEVPRAYHVGRVAYLVVHGWDDPIDIDVGNPSIGYHTSNVVCDGWHRLAASAFLKKKYIKCAWSGENAEARRLLFRGKIK